QEELEQERARAEHEKQQLVETRRREQALMEERHRQEFEQLHSTYEHAASAKGQEHKLTLQAQHNRFIREETAKDLKEIGYDALGQRQEDREEAKIQRQEQRELRGRRLQARYDLTKRVIDRGHGDDVHLDVGTLINGVGETSLAAAQDAYALEEGEGDEVHQV